MGFPDTRTTTGTMPALARLRAASSRARRLLVLRGGVMLAAAAVLAAFATLGLDLWLRPGVPARVTIGLLIFGVLALIAWRFVIAPARIRLDPLEVAAVWDRARPDSGDRLVQSVGTLTRSSASGELSEIARERASRHLAAADF